MDTASEILKRVRRVELKARRMASETFAGGYQSSFRGQGLDFDDFREYMPGDEPRFIDWKVTARMGSPFVRKFREDREISLMLVVDTSASMRYGSQAHSKLEYAAELAAVLAFSAQHTGDKCGLLLFGKEPRLFLPPAKGYKQVLRIVREVLNSPNDDPGAGLEPVCQRLLNMHKRSLVILISDFLFPPDKVALGKLNFKHELVTLRVNDPAEITPPDAGQLLLRDPETAQVVQVNLGNSLLRRKYTEMMEAHRSEWKTIMNQTGIDSLDLATDQNYSAKLQQLFRTRTKRYTV